MLGLVWVDRVCVRALKCPLETSTGASKGSGAISYQPQPLHPV